MNASRWMCALVVLSLALFGSEVPVFASEDPGVASEMPADELSSAPTRRQVEWEAVQRFNRVYVDSARSLPWTARYMGMPISQNPADMWVLQEIIHEVRPDVIVETGTYRGGSALYYATLLAHSNPGGRVVSIDIAPQHDATIAQIESVTLRDNARRIFEERVEVITSDSVAPELIERLEDELRGQRVMVVLDSCHNSDHVFKELELYSRLVTPGSYLVVQDTLIDENPEWIEKYAQCDGYESAGGPGKGVRDFLAERDDFEVDASRERYMLTFCPGGFLKKLPN